MRIKGSLILASAAIILSLVGCGLVETTEESASASEVTWGVTEFSAEESKSNIASDEEGSNMEDPVTPSPERESMIESPIDSALSIESEIQEMPEEDARVLTLLNTLTLEEKIAQLFVVTPEALTGYSGTVTAAGDLTQASFDQKPVGGIIYMGPNLQNSNQTRSMLEEMQKISINRIGVPAFLCVDEEGGSVARISGYSGFGISDYPDMCEVGASGNPEWAEEIGEEMGTYLSDLGFNVDFAPVADVWSNSQNTVVKYRAFSSDPEVVATMTSAFAKGLSSQSVLYAYKHFPGHGNTASDSHNGFAESDSDIATLYSRELIPFRDGIEHGVPMIMVGHISLPNVTGDNLPASLSREIITTLLRENLGYDGIVITDAMNMGAISDNYSSGEAAVMALEAGVDLILMPANFDAAFNAVLEAAQNGELSEEQINKSLTRIFTAKFKLVDQQSPQ